jgi:hypothetical protein
MVLDYLAGFGIKGQGRGAASLQSGPVYEGTSLRNSGTAMLWGCYWTGDGK